MWWSALMGCAEDSLEPGFVEDLVDGYACESPPATTGATFRPVWYVAATADETIRLQADLSEPTGSLPSTAASLWVYVGEDQLPDDGGPCDDFQADAVGTIDRQYDAVAGTATALDATGDRVGLVLDAVVLRSDDADEVTIDHAVLPAFEVYGVQVLR